jgi:hypothetical protein
MASRGGGIAVFVVVGLLAVGAADQGCEPPDEGDGATAGREFDFGIPDEGGASGGGASGGLPICDGTVTVETDDGVAEVPASGGSTACAMREGRGGGEAVARLQVALARCHRQDVAVDGVFGPQTRRALSRETGDGTYGPDTLDALQWVGTTDSGVPGCVSV